MAAGCLLAVAVLSTSPGSASVRLVLLLAIIASTRDAERRPDLLRRIEEGGRCARVGFVDAVHGCECQRHESKPKAGVGGEQRLQQVPQV